MSSGSKQNYTLKPIDIEKTRKILVENELSDRLTISSFSSKYITALLTPKEFALLKEEEFIYDLRSCLPQEESFLSDFFPEVNAISVARLRFPIYFADDGVISVKENDISPDDIDLLGRVTTSFLSAGVEKSHAADMATIIAGKGNTINASRGVMENAHISTTSFLNLLPDADLYFKENQILVQNHSYGIEIEDYYGLEAQAYDEQVFENPSLVHVFSAGNRGGESSIFSPYADLDAYANITGTFKQAKNVLTIGGIDSFAVLSTGSSIGPAHDGRIKPELVAYGYNGTSDAAAITSACSAAIMSALKMEELEQDAGSVKAILVAGSDDLGPVGPDFQTGFGKVNLLNSLTIANEKNLLTGEIGADEILEFDIEVPDSADFKVVLTWIDPPAEIDNNKALVNDLDLQVIDIKGMVHFPYQMKYLPEEIASNLANSYGRDSINNIEMVVVPSAVGKFKIRVTGHHIPQGSQTFSIAYLQQNMFQFIYPFEGAYVQSGKEILPMWNGEGNDRVDFLEFVSFDILDPYQSESRHLFPDTSAVVRGIAFTNADRSDEVEFLVSDIPKMKVGWMCGDSVLITWDKSSFQDSFEIMGLVDDLMLPIGITSKNYFLIDQSAYKYVAIRERIGSYAGPRSLALNISSTQANCLYDRFYSSPLENGLRISLELNSSVFVNALILEKYVSESWIGISTLDESLLDQSYDDLDLLRGNNEYRVKIILEDGGERFTEVVSYFYIPSDEVLVFPTILEADYGIDVWMGDFRPMEFNLLNGQGQLIIQEDLLSEFEYFDTSGLSKGIYFYFLRDEKAVFSSGRIIIL